MRTEKVTLLNESGLHARPASLFVKTGSKFKADLTIQKEEKIVNAKSILGILSLGIAKGEEVILAAQGPDEEEAISELVKLIQAKFNEE